MLIKNRVSPLIDRIFLQKMKWVLVLIVASTCISCSSVQHSSLADYYWDVQSLKLQASIPEKRAASYRDLGIIYLRTGNYDLAEDIFTRAINLERSDPEGWFYAGLTDEFLARPDAAMRKYERAPTVSAESRYSRATKGRMDLLEARRMRQSFDLQLHQETLPDPQNMAPDRHVVLPLNVLSGSSEFTHLGKGLSEIISRDINLLPGVTIVEPGIARMALERYTAVRGQGNEDRARALGTLVEASKLIEGSMSIDMDDNVVVELTVHDFTENTVSTINASGSVNDLSELEKDIMENLLEVLRIWLPNQERRLPVTSVSLDALVRFSQGLEREDQGQFTEAVQRYEQALSLFPRFRPVELKIEQVENKVLAAGQSEQELLALLERLEYYSPAPYLMEARMRQLGSSLNTGFVPGQDARKLPSGSVGELPSPPRPTGN